MHRAAAAVATLAFAAAAVAQNNLGGLSANCTQTAEGFLSGDLASCLNIISLVGLATTSGSIVPGLQNYITGVCGQAPCSMSTINTARSQFQSGCASDIQQGNVIAVALNAVLSDYTDTRGLLCSQYTANGTYCLPTTLYAVQNATGQTLSLSAFAGLTNGNGVQSLLSSVPCTDCVHAIVTEASKIVVTNSTSAANSVKSAAASKCGSAFGDGQVPSSVTTSGSGSGASAASASSSSGRSSGAAPLALGWAPAAGVAAAGLAAVAGGLLTLA